MKYLFSTILGLFISSIMLNVLLDKRQDYSVIYFIDFLNTKAEEEPILGQDDGDELSEVENIEIIEDIKHHNNEEEIQKTRDFIQSSYTSQYRQENIPSYYKELISLRTNMYWDKELEDRYIKYKINNSISWLVAITFVNIGIDIPRYSNIREIEEPEALDVWVDKYRNLPSDFLPSDLKKVQNKYCSRSLELRNEACEAFESLCDAALEDGIRLIAVSAFRDYEYQQELGIQNTRRVLLLMLAVTKIVY